MIAELATVFLLHWAALLSPGAATLLMMQLSATQSRRRAHFASLGIACSALSWASLAIIGVNAIFVAFPALRFAVQCAGGAYLIYIATRVWRSGALKISKEKSLIESDLAAFRLGFVSNMLNPKAAVFFGSVFAAGLPAAPSTALLFAALAMVFANSLVWHGALARIFSSPHIQHRYERNARAISRVSASLLGSVGAGLIASVARELRLRANT